jgi:hypothetical protein
MALSRPVEKSGGDSSKGKMLLTSGAAVARRKALLSPESGDRTKGSDKSSGGHSGGLKRV